MFLFLCSSAEEKTFDLHGYCYLFVLGLVWRGCVPFNWKLVPPYHPKDVTSKNWTPFEPMIHIFTPKKSKWSLKKRLWREGKRIEKQKRKNLTIIPERPEYSDPSKINWELLKIKFSKIFDNLEQKQKLRKKKFTKKKAIIKADNDIKKPKEILKKPVKMPIDLT